MFAEIPKLSSSSDYPRWSQTITAYLGVQKALKVITKEPPNPKAEGFKQEEMDTWEELEGIARGVIILSLHPTIAEGIDPEKSVATIWAELKGKYGKPGPSGTYLEFKKVLATEIPNNSDPSHALETIKTGFTRLKALDCEVPHKIQILIYMSKLGGSGQDLIVQNISATSDLTEVDIADLERLIRLNWEQKASKRTPMQEIGRAHV